MLDYCGPLSTRSTLSIPPLHSVCPLQKLHGWHWPNDHPRLKEGDLVDHRTPGEPHIEQGHITEWLDNTRLALSHSAPQTPPPDMDTLSANAMLVPRYGGLANMSTAVKPMPALYQANGGFYGDKSLAQALNQSMNKASARPSSPDRWNDRESANYSSRRRDSEEPIASYLQIPNSINNSKGSLSEFAAQITCLFWFESSFTLHRVEEGKYPSAPQSPLALEAMPNMGFRKWVTTILSTTQVTQNVILLALMFIYRLKKLNPTVKGKSGSEFRLLTVALMLGNKFLDDNTYTNKTWAEVSGISVQEIHIMEVEFLSNMKYTLYVSELEWAAWHQKLGRFWDYFDKASTGTLTRGPGSLLNMAPNLPSPPASIQASPPYQSSNGPTTKLHPLSMPPYLAPSIPCPAARMPDVDLRPSSRKRSYEDAGYDPPSKRPITAFSSSAGPTTSFPSNSPSRESAAVRLPVPRLSVTAGGSSAGFFASSYSAQLPPPSTRPPAVWPHQGPRTWSHHSSRNPSPLTIPSSTSIPSLPPMSQHYQYTPNSNSTGTVAQSTPNTTSTNTVSRDSSPTNGNFSQQSSQDLLSPSGYPTQRSSPYRPVRGVNTLLVPPPSASLHLPAQQVGSQNMHYQPIGRPASERKTGVVPYLHHQDGWLANSQPNMPWPTLPQPQQSHATY